MPPTDQPTEATVQRVVDGDTVDVVVDGDERRVRLLNIDTRSPSIPTRRSSVSAPRPPSTLRSCSRSAPRSAWSTTRSAPIATAGIWPACSRARRS
ncbi:hypothetical protein NKG05_22805 [Oerskovia sp. M15]